MTRTGMEISFENLRRSSKTGTCFELTRDPPCPCEWALHVFVRQSLTKHNFLTNHKRTLVLSDTREVSQGPVRLLEVQWYSPNL